MNTIKNVLWAQKFGGTSNDAGYAIAADSAGNTYVTGGFNGIANFGNTTLTSTGSLDAFVAKFDSSGKVLWAQKLGGTSTEIGYGITVDGAGNSYATGNFSGTATFGSTTLTSTGNEDAFVTKLDSSGNFLWAQKLGGTTSDSSYSITTDGAGNTYVTGVQDVLLSTFNSVQLGNSTSNDNAFITKLDNNGNVLWTKNLSGVFSSERGHSITSDGTGNTYVTGFFSGTNIFGNTTLTSNGSIDAFITKLDSSGNFLWAQKLGGTLADGGFGITSDGVGNIYATGTFRDTATFGSTTLTSAGDEDAFVAKLDGNGNVVWAKKFGSIGVDNSFGIVTDGLGNIYVTGGFNGTVSFGSTTLTSAGDYDAFIAKLDSDGNILSAYKLGGTLFDTGIGITSDGKGNIYATGGFSDTGSFGNTSLTSAGSRDGFVVKLGEPKITLAVTPSSVAEDGTDNLTYTFTREGNTTDPLTVNFNVSGTGTFDNDYTQTGAASFSATNGTVTFAAGATTATITIDPTADTTVESDETVGLTLVGGAGYSIATSGAVTGNITNDDTQITLAVTPSSVAEDGTDNLTYTFTRQGKTTDPLTVNFNVGGNATVDNDYTQTGAASFSATNGTVTFAAGATTATITIDPTADTTFEPDETVGLTLAAGTDYTIGTSEAVTGNITNDDTQVTLAVTPSSVLEDGTDNLTYTFTRQGKTTDPLTVNFNVGGNATVDTDYTQTGAASFSATNGTVTFAAGATTATVTIDPTVDTTKEPDETVGLTLAAGTGYSIGTSEAVTGNITNDDPRITLALAANSVTEDGTDNLTYTFTRQGQTTDPLTVNFNVSGNATYNTDYTATGANTFTATNGTVTFAAGATTATITIDPTTDTTFEPDETVGLTLAAGTDYTIGTSEAVTGNITNDDTQVTLAVTPSTVSEDGTDNLTYTFTRQGKTTDPLTVNFNVAGTATVDNDYTQTGAASFSATNGTVTFAAGATTATVTIDPTADTTVESDETVRLTLAAGTGYNIATSEAVTGKITNDDTQVTLAVTPSSVTEDGSDNLTYTFTRQGKTTDPLTVNFNVSGDATFNDDYTAVDADSFSATNGTVTFKAGATTATVTIDPTADTKVEPDEILGLTLATGTGYTIGTSEAVTGKITNDDITPALKATPAPNIGNIFNLEGEAKSVQFLLKSASSGVVNEIGLFQVDDDKGTIGGVAPDDPKYAQKALENSRSIFSTLGNRPSGFNDNLTSTIDLDAGIQFRLLLVQNGTIDGLRNGTVPLSQMLLSSPTSSPVADGKFDLSFPNSPGTVVQMSLGTEGLKGISLQDKQQGEVLDLTKLTGTQTATFTVYREAAFDNLVGFYRVADASGAIDTNNDGVGDLLPGQAGYAEAAVKNRVGDINLRVGNQGTASFTGTFEGGSIFAPFLIVKGTADAFLDNNPNNNPAIYFPYLGANSDNVDHVRMLGNNIFGFEDLSGGGDKDFNDIIVSVKFS